MYVEGKGDLGAWIRDEVEFRESVVKGARGRKAQRIQEWLNLNGLGIVVDGDFGNITKRRVGDFQSREGLPVTGEVDRATFDLLTVTMRSVLQPPEFIGGTFAETMTELARAHLAVHPVEVGGQNCGPWVRLYMKGNQGSAWPWCAGFVTFLMKQASELLEEPAPIKGSFSCDTLAAQAKAKDIFLRESAAEPDGLVDGSLFLVRRTSTDWTHVGMLKEADGIGFGTIEGNTNDEGSREGFEVCERVRGYDKKDFILL